MNVAKYMIDLFPDPNEQLDKLIEFKEDLHLVTYKEDCGCIYYIKGGEEPLYIFLNICLPHKFENKLIVEEIQAIHKRSFFKPLLWSEE